jgi:hypothetical protein
MISDYERDFLYVIPWNEHKRYMINMHNDGLEILIDTLEN